MTADRSLDLSSILLRAEHVLAMPYKMATPDTDVLLKRMDSCIRDPESTTSVRKQLKALRDKLIAHRAECQMELFSSCFADRV